jgi:hypothetical protein
MSNSVEMQTQTPCLGDVLVKAIVLNVFVCGAIGLILGLPPE